MKERTYNIYWALLWWESFTKTIHSNSLVSWLSFCLLVTRAVLTDSPWWVKLPELGATIGAQLPHEHIKVLGRYLQFSPTVPFGPTWALQWRFPWRPGSCPAAWGRVFSRHPSAGTPGWCESAAPPGKCWHTQTPACPHRDSATTGYMTPTRFTPIFQTYLKT